MSILNYIWIVCQHRLWHVHCELTAYRERFPPVYIPVFSFFFLFQLMDKECYRDIEKIKTIGSTYMAAVGLVPTTASKVHMWELYSTSVCLHVFRVLARFKNALLKGLAYLGKYFLFITLPRFSQENPLWGITGPVASANTTFIAFSIKPCKSDKQKRPFCNFCTAWNKFSR